MFFGDDSAQMRRLPSATPISLHLFCGFCCLDAFAVCESFVVQNYGAMKRKKIVGILMSQKILECSFGMREFGANFK